MIYDKNMFHTMKQTCFIAGETCLKQDVSNIIVFSFFFINFVF
jgi:hypothetical protein